MRRLSSIPFFLYLLPLYFYLVGITDYGVYGEFLIIAKDLALLFIISLLIHISIKYVAYNRKSVFVLCFLLYFAYLFFGNAKESVHAFSFLYSYYIFTPLYFLSPFLLYYFTRKKDAFNTSIFSYLNVLMLLLTTMQFVQSIKHFKMNLNSYHKPIHFSNDRALKRPSIYFVLFDQYPGQLSLNRYYHFENKILFSHLREQGFYVYDTMRSNYDRTVFSVNSTLNMQYLDTAMYMPVSKNSTYLKNYISIKKNTLIPFLVNEGYDIKNYSLFELGSFKTNYSFSQLNTPSQRLLQNVFHQKLLRDLFWKFCLGSRKIDYLYKKYLLQTHLQNNEIIDKLINDTSTLYKKPIFMYAHLLLPHDPFYCDSMGNLMLMGLPQKLSDTCKEAFSYLQYTNKRMMQIADSLVSHDPNSIIVLLSDHGYRDVSNASKDLHCDNFLAIHLPDAHQDELEKIKSNINIFPVLLNIYFNQRIPIKKDSSFLIDEVNNKITLLQNMR